MTDWPRSWRVNPQTPSARALTPPEGRPWYKISNKGTATAEIYIYDEIGYFGVAASDFVRDLQGVTARSINLRISSPGGEVFDGIAIYEALRRHPADVTTYVDSLAASIASVIAMAGDRRVIARNATMMVHDASGLTVGPAGDMREMADLLDRLSDNIADIYSQRAGGTVKDWRKAMLAETWYSAGEALNAGLATEQADVEDTADQLLARLRAGVPSASTEWTHTVAHLTSPLQFGEDR